jgi:hypothetical protein
MSRNAFMMPSGDDATFPETLSAEIMANANDLVKRVWKGREEKKLTDREFLALGLTIGTTAELFHSLASDEWAPLQDLSEKEIAGEGALSAGWDQLLLLMFHALEQIMRGEPEVEAAIGSDVETLLAKLNAVAPEVGVAQLQHGLEALDYKQEGAQHPREAYIAAVNEFHVALVGKAINERPLPRALAALDSDLISQYPADLYYVQIYMDAWAGLYRQLRDRLAIGSD